MVKRAVEEGGIELMNERGYKNRKLRGKGEVSRKKRSRLSQFRELD